MPPALEPRSTAGRSAEEPRGRPAGVAQVGRAACLLLLLAVGAGAATAWLHPAWVGYAEGRLSAGEIAPHRVPAGALWVDARSAEEYAKAHVPGAILLNEDDWEGGLVRFFEAWVPDRPVVVYCGSEGCAASKQVAARLQREVGSGTYQHLKGGWEAWQSTQP